MTYVTSHIKRKRSTQAEMWDFKNDISLITRQHQPATVRQIYYRSVVAGLVSKDDSGYNRVQRALVQMRRAEQIPYSWIVDNVRLVRRVDTFDSVEEALSQTARFYRRNLWELSDERVEVWVESDSIASVINAVTSEWTIELFATRGFSSVTFTQTAAMAANRDGRPLRVLWISDHDPAGLELEAAARRDLESFCDVPVRWERLGVTWQQVEDMDLPGTKPKKPYGYPMAVETEALPPGVLRQLVWDAIERRADQHHLDVLLAAEESEREILTRMAGGRR